MIPHFYTVLYVSNVMFVDAAVRHASIHYPAHHCTALSSQPTANSHVPCCRVCSGAAHLNAAGASRLQRVLCGIPLLWA